MQACWRVQLISSALHQQALFCDNKSPTPSIPPLLNSQPNPSSPGGIVRTTMACSLPLLFPSLHFSLLLLDAYKHIIVSPDLTPPFHLETGPGWGPARIQISCDRVCFNKHYLSFLLLKSSDKVAGSIQRFLRLVLMKQQPPMPTRGKVRTCWAFMFLRMSLCKHCMLSVSGRINQSVWSYQPSCLHTKSSL